MTMRRYISNLVIATMCVTGLCGLGMLRFQRVEIQDAATQHTHRYWRVLLPGQDNTVSLEKEGHYNAREHNIKGLYGLLNLECLSGARYKPCRIKLTLSDPIMRSFRQGIEDAERINVQQMERWRQSWERIR